MNPNYEEIREKFSVSEQFINHKIAVDKFFEKLENHSLFPEGVISKFNEAEQKIS